MYCRKVPPLYANETTLLQTFHSQPYYRFVIRCPWVLLSLRQLLEDFRVYQQPSDIFLRVFEGYSQPEDIV